MQTMFNTSSQGGVLQMIIMILLMHQGMYNRSAQLQIVQASLLEVPAIILGHRKISSMLLTATINSTINQMIAAILMVLE